MLGKANNYAKWTKFGNILIGERRMWQKGDRYDMWMKKWRELYFKVNFLYSRLNTGLSRYFSLIAPKISFKYNSMTLEKHIFNPKPVLKIPNTYRTMHLLRQGLSFISNIAGHVEVALCKSEPSSQSAIRICWHLSR